MNFLNRWSNNEEENKGLARTKPNRSKANRQKKTARKTEKESRRKNR